MDKKTAFIGSGNMGGAIIRGSLRVLSPEQVIITDSDFSRAQELAAELGCTASLSNLEATRAADIVFLCIKPGVLPSVVEEIAPVLRASGESGKPKLLCSIAAGVSSGAIRDMLGAPACPVIRIMPNSPAFIGKGLLLLSDDDAAEEGDMEELVRILSGCGTVERLDEELFDQATAVASCSPAFVYMFIEALADSGVMMGLGRESALRFASHAVMGAGAMALETGEHPGRLKDMVCSPGGSTIAGVARLEELGFRGSVIEAAAASYKAVKK